MKPSPLSDAVIDEHQRYALETFIASYMLQNPYSLTPQAQLAQIIGMLLLEVRNIKDPADMLGDVARFHMKFGQAYVGPPQHLDEEERVFRLKCLREEVQEYEDADNLEGELDALVDLIYFALGTAYRHGFHEFREAWRRVHAKNMTKRLVIKEGESKRGHDRYDIVKPEGFVPADLSDLVGAGPPPIIPRPKVKEVGPLSGNNMPDPGPTAKK
jgi:predicted HAD superfamily Cof-like phosphohydrolase